MGQERLGVHTSPRGVVCGAGRGRTSALAGSDPDAGRSIAPESFGGAVGPSFHPAGRGAGRGHLELRPPSSGGAWREGAGDALSHARPVLSGLKMAAAAGVRSRRRGREKESL